MVLAPPAPLPIGPTPNPNPAAAPHAHAHAHAPAHRGVGVRHGNVHLARLARHLHNNRVVLGFAVHPQPHSQASLAALAALYATPRLPLAAPHQHQQRQRAQRRDGRRNPVGTTVLAPAPAPPQPGLAAQVLDPVSAPAPTAAATVPAAAAASSSGKSSAASVGSWTPFERTLARPSAFHRPVALHAPAAQAPEQQHQQQRRTGPEASGERAPGPGTAATAVGGLSNLRSPLRQSAFAMVPSTPPAAALREEDDPFLSGLMCVVEDAASARAIPTVGSLMGTRALPARPGWPRAGDGEASAALKAPATTIEVEMLPVTVIELHPTTDTDDGLSFASSTVTAPASSSPLMPGSPTTPTVWGKDASPCPAVMVEVVPLRTPLAAPTARRPAAPATAGATTTAAQEEEDDAELVWTNTSVPTSTGAKPDYKLVMPRNPWGASMPTAAATAASSSSSSPLEQQQQRKGLHPSPTRTASPRSRVQRRAAPYPSGQRDQAGPTASDGSTAPTAPMTSPARRAQAKRAAERRTASAAREVEMGRLLNRLETVVMQANVAHRQAEGRLGYFADLNQRLGFPQPEPAAAAAEDERPMGWAGATAPLQWSQVLQQMSSNSAFAVP